MIVYKNVLLTQTNGHAGVLRPFVGSIYESSSLKIAHFVSIH